MIIGNLTVRPFFFTNESRKNYVETDTMSIGLMIESDDIDKVIARSFFKFRLSFYSSVMVPVIVLHAISLLMILA
jgi:hypothetical protein